MKQAIDALKIFAWINAVASTIAALFCWSQYGSIDTGHYSSEINAIGVGLGFAILFQGLFGCALFLVIADIAENVIYMREKLEYQERSNLVDKGSQINPAVSTIKKLAREQKKISQESPKKETLLPVDDLGPYIKIINDENLDEAVEVYYNRALKFEEESERESSILEFVKVVRKSSPDNRIHQGAKDHLMEMGFSEADIRQIVIYRR